MSPYCQMSPGAGGGRRITPVESHQPRGTVTVSHKDSSLISALGLDKPQLTSSLGRWWPHQQTLQPLQEAGSLPTPSILSRGNRHPLFM